MTAIGDTPSALPTVTIVGAGPSGLTLARYLQIHHVPCIVYERELSATARLQGGTLDLHQDTGLEALLRTGLLEEAKTMMRSEGEAMKIVDKNGKVWHDENDYEQISSPRPSGLDVARGRPEIDRTDLRNLLLRSLEPETVKWGHGVKSCTALDNDTYEITFEDGTTTTTSFLVGADGTFSRIRPLLHGVKPPYSGCSMYDMSIPASRMTPSLHKLVGAGVAMILEQGKCLLPQMNSGGKCKVYVGLYCPETWIDENPLPATGRKEWFKKLYEGWAPEILELFDAIDEASITPRRIYAYDPNLKWSTDLSGVTVMGDAAHVMSPFAGEGVNQAMADAFELGETLVSLYRAPRPLASLPPFPLSLLPVSPPLPDVPPLQAPERAGLHAALRKYERKMMRRAGEEMKGSKENLEICFGPDPARRLTNMFYWMMAQGIMTAVVPPSSALGLLLACIVI